MTWHFDYSTNRPLGVACMLYFTTSTTLLGAVTIALNRIIASIESSCPLDHRPYRAVKECARAAFTHMSGRSTVWRPLETTSLHDHALPIRRHDHTLLIGDLDFVFALFLFDFLGEPFFHEAISSAPSSDQSDVLTSRQPDRASLISA